MLDYVIKPCELLGEPKKYRAVVVGGKSYTFEDIANDLSRHNTGISGPEINAVWKGIKDMVMEYLSNGGSINTELFQIHPSIQGVFTGTDDKFERGRHTVRHYMKPGSLLLDVPATLKPRKVNRGARTFIESVTDVKSGAEDSLLSPGKIIRIKGRKLKIDGPDPANGLYFEADDALHTQVKVEQSEYVVNKPSEILAVIPNLKKGTWKIRLVTQYSTGGDKYLKTPLTARFEKSLTVA